MSHFIKKITTGGNKFSGIFLAALKVALAIALFPIALITFHYVTSEESWVYYIVICLIIICSAMYIIFPFMSDYSKLAGYVKHLSFDRIVKPPKLESSIAVIELSESLDLLKKSWEKKQREVLEKIAEIKLLFSSIPEVMFIINESLIISKVNNAAEQVFGSNLIGMSLREITDNKILLGAVRWVLHDQISKRVELYLGAPIERDYQVLIEVYDSKENGEKNLIIMMHDVSELKRTEKMLADFIANASHEVRTPLTGIIGIIETLDIDGWDDKEARKLFIPMIREQAYCMKNLIDDLLSLSSIERRLNTPPTEIVDIAQVVDLVVKQLEWEAMQSKIAVIRNIDEHLPSVLGDFNELSQVVFNLLANALKYSGHDKEIKIDIGVTDVVPRNGVFTQENSKAIFISIADQGNGIASEHLPRLTERFYRIEPSRSKKLGGTGLGLAIVKQILLRHRGFLNIESTVGKGSIFTVYLPILSDRYE